MQQLYKIGFKNDPADYVIVKTVFPYDACIKASAKHNGDMPTSVLIRVSDKPWYWEDVINPQ